MPDVTEHYKYDFFSGANIGIFFGNTRVSEAVGIEFNLSQTKRPIYGWASQLYDGVSDGIVQCMGSLYLNFRQAHMMTGIINNSKQITYSDPENTESIPSSSSIPGLTSAQIDQLIEQHWGRHDANLDRASGSQLPLSASGSRPDDHGTGFRIWITYGDFFGGNGSNTVRTLHGVHITGFGQTIEINGNPVLEAYNFLARQVT